MSINKQFDTEYRDWLSTLKSKIKSVQVKAALSANKVVILLYWEIGKELYDKQENNGWGNAIVDSLEKDLNQEFPKIKGFSRRNLFYMKSFYHFYKDGFEKVQQLVAQILWGHNILIYSKSANIEEALFYLSETIEFGWSRSILSLQFDTDLYLRKGKAITNFDKTLPNPDSYTVNHNLKNL